MNKPLKVNAKQTRSEASPELTRARPFLPRRLSQQSFCIFTSFRLSVIICHDVINIPLKGTRGARVLVASCVNRSCVGPSDHKALFFHECLLHHLSQAPARRDMSVLRIHTFPWGVFLPGAGGRAAATAGGGLAALRTRGRLHLAPSLSAGFLLSFREAMSAGPARRLRAHGGPRS